MSETEPEKEIIIVRRRHSGGEEEHHGGVWKIAYADFMTVMMVFFLIMWLINAVSEDTKTAIASYFNPIRLEQVRAPPRGLREMQGHIRQEEKGEEDGPSREDEGPAGNAKAIAEEVHLMENPYKMLDDLAGARTQGDERGQDRKDTPENEQQTNNAAGNAYRDPFSPEYWKSNIPDDRTDSVWNQGVGAYETANGNGPGSAEPVGSQEKGEEHPSSGTAESVGKDISSMIDIAEAVKVEPVRTETEAEAAADSSRVNIVSDFVMAGSGKAESSSVDEQAGEQKEPENREPTVDGKDEKHAGIAEIISQEVENLKNDQPEDSRPQMRVSRTDNGVSIEVTDSQGYSMFSVGSARPDGQLVSLLEKVAKILEKQEGKVIISGYTDARPYKTLHYDNWQLSAARAQMAYYILVRGGLDEKRVLRVEGYADRDLKNSKDSYAAENRRISVFLQFPEEEKH